MAFFANGNKEFEFDPANLTHSDFDDRYDPKALASEELTQFMHIGNSYWFIQYKFHLKSTGKRPFRTV